jgi:glutamate dehydrogenase (NAD(P)+)
MTKILNYEDPVTGSHGWLAYDGESAPLAAGGCRARTGVTAAELAILASRMTLKQRVLGLNVDGAKCGIDCGVGPARSAVLGRFVNFLREELGSRFSMGPDMGTEWQELQTLAARAGIPSTKYAIKKAQGLTDEEFFARMSVFSERAGLLTFSQLRAGHALAHAVIGAARASGSTRRFSCALQGFGNLGRAVAYTLAMEGVPVTALADEHGCLAEPRGLDIATMLSRSPGTPVPALDPAVPAQVPEAVFSAPADVLVLAACADALGPEDTVTCPFPAVVVGANCGLSAAAERELHSRGVFVVPDFVGGIGGSASMEALFGPRRQFGVTAVLDSLADMMRQLIDDIAANARQQGGTPGDAALKLAGSAVVEPGAPPYGHCRYLFSRAGASPVPYSGK